MNLILNDQPAVKIFARRLVDKPAFKAVLYDCEGDKKWIPRKVSKYNDKDGTLLIEEWFYNKEFKN